MALTLRVKPTWPVTIAGSGGVTVTQSGGRATIGFDLSSTELGTELDQAVATATAQAVLAQTAASSVADAATAAAAATFTQTGTGAVSRALSDVYKDKIFTPEQFGAKGDTQIIKTAITTIAGNTALTVSTSMFSASDVGKVISIGSAGYWVPDASVTGTGIAAAGTGFPNGSFVSMTFTGGTAVTPAVLFIETDSTGHGLSFNQFTTLGKYSVTPNNPVTLTGSTGTGMTFNVGWRQIPHTTTIAQYVSPTQVVLAAAPIATNTAVSDYVYFGTDDTSAIESAIAASLVAQAKYPGITLQLSRGYTSTAMLTVSLPANTHGFTIKGNGRSSFLHCAISTDSSFGLYVTGPGVSGAPSLITADAAFGTHSLSTNNTFSVGDILQIYSQTSLGTAGERGQMNIVDDVSTGPTYQLRYPFYFAIDHTQPSLITKVVCAEDVTVDGLIVDGFGSSGTSLAGTVFEYLFRPVIRIKAKNWWTDSSGVNAGEIILEGDIDVRTYRCGGGTGADAVGASYATGCRFKLSQEKTWGFGIGLDFVSGNQLDLTSNRTLGRSIKFYGSCGNVGDLQCSYSPPGWVGVAFTDSSSFNTFRTVSTVSHNQGVWTDGSGCNYNSMLSVRIANNTTDFAISTNDIKFTAKVAPMAGSAVIVDGGTSTSIT